MEVIYNQTKVIDYRLIDYALQFKNIFPYINNAIKIFRFSICSEKQKVGISYVYEIPISNCSNYQFSNYHFTKWQIAWYPTELCKASNTESKMQWIDVLKSNYVGCIVKEEREAFLITWNFGHWFWNASLCSINMTPLLFRNKQWNTKYKKFCLCMTNGRQKSYAKIISFTFYRRCTPHWQGCPVKEADKGERRSPSNYSDNIINKCDTAQ